MTAKTEVHQAQMCILSISGLAVYMLLDLYFSGFKLYPYVVLYG